MSRTDESLQMFCTMVIFICISVFSESKGKSVAGKILDIIRKSQDAIIKTDRRMAPRIANLWVLAGGSAWALSWLQEHRQRW